MTITLNSIALSEDLIWSNEFDYEDITQTIERTVGGSLIISNFAKNEGREIVLEAVNNGNTFTGYFTRLQVKNFKVLEKEATTVVFEYNGQVFSVIVKSGGVAVTPLMPRPDHEDTDYYTGTLTLLTV